MLQNGIAAWPRPFGLSKARSACSVSRLVGLSLLDATIWYRGSDRVVLGPFLERRTSRATKRELCSDPAIGVAHGKVRRQCAAIFFFNPLVFRAPRSHSTDQTRTDRDAREGFSRSPSFGSTLWVRGRVQRLLDRRRVPARRAARSRRRVGRQRCERRRGRSGLVARRRERRGWQ